MIPAKVTAARHRLRRTLVQQCSFQLIIFGLLLSVSGCYAQQNTAGANTLPVAFPGAEGFGKYASGGRGGKVYIVTNLNDDGEGSFRKAATANHPRIIVFAVSGTIHLNSSISIKSNATIAGHTAPGDGICVADKSVQLGGDNIILRYMRFRLGDKWQRQQGKVDGSGGEDAFSGSGRKHIIIDHCTFSWSNDECLSVYNGDSTTLQWNIIAEPLNYSYHFETGDTDWEHHGYGGIWGGAHLSAHHNLLAHCNNRMPRFNGIRQKSTELVDYANNVIYNWGGNHIYAGEGGNYNLINNYYKSGPSTNKNVKERIASPGRTDKIPFGKWYVSGNYVDGAPAVTKDNSKGIVMGNNGSDEDKTSTLVTTPHAAMPIVIQTARDAYEDVLKSAGASFKRDTLDERIVNNVRQRSGTIIDVQGGYPHHSAYEITVNAWPVLKSLPAPADADNDGMPDAWEKKQGLNPNDASDASARTLHHFYTNIEMYINSLLL
ncbi:MAG: pectate lyase [Flavihumibacter sp.]|nr:pectate lyase [Flavihumibacter sp.]